MIQKKIEDYDVSRVNLTDELYEKYVKGTTFTGSLKQKIRFFRKKYTWILIVGGAKFLKRAIDVCAVVVLLILLSPLFAFVVISIKLTDDVPVMFFQKRVGLWGKEINFLKFNMDLPKQGRHIGTRRRREFFYCTIPRMFGVIYGKLHVVGLAGRTIGSIEILEDDWRELYLKGKIGVISEASVIYDNAPNADELFTAEAFYSVKKCFKHDLKLFLAYICKLFVF